MPGIRILQIDAFTDRPFAGNPAAVCLLEEEQDAVWMQSVGSSRSYVVSSSPARLEA